MTSTVNLIMKIVRTLAVAFAAMAVAFAAVCCGEKPEPDQDDNGHNGNRNVPAGFKEEEDDKSADINGTFNYASLVKQGHPRLLMNESEWTEYKARVKSSSILKLLDDAVMAKADGLVDNPETVEYKLDASGRRLLTQCRTAQRTLVNCAYAYRMTGDRKYLTRVKAMLKTVCGFKDWHPDHYLDVAEMSLGVAIAYDWLYYDLSLAERQQIHKCLIEYAFKTSAGQSYHSSTGNWNQVCYCGLTYAALALYEKDKAICRKYIEEMVRNNGNAMSTMYAPDGNYPEGYMYWNYGTWFETILLGAIEHAFGRTAGLAESEGFLKTADFMLFMADPVVNYCFPYADCTTSMSECPAMWWFAGHRNEPSLLSNEINLLKAGKYDDRLLALVPLLSWKLDFSRAENTKAMPEIWSGNGKVPVILVHTGWKSDSSDKYLGIKGGAANGNHGHMDAGSFVYDAYGVRWAHDPGKEDYATLEKQMTPAGGNLWSYSQNSFRWDTFRYNNLAHSTISVYPAEYYEVTSDKFADDPAYNGMLHVSDHYAKGKAEIVEVYSGHDRLGGRLDMTGVLSKQLESATRSICLEGENLVVTDVVTTRTDKPVVVEWRMFKGKNVTVKVTDSCVELTGGKTVLKLMAETGGLPVTYRDFGGNRPAYWEPRTWDTQNKSSIVGYNVTIPGGMTATLVTVLGK